MPCFTISTVTVNVKAMKLDQLQRALESMGYKTALSLDKTVLAWGSESYNKATNELRVTSQNRAQEIVQGYARQGVMELAKKFGYQIKQNPLDKNKMTLQKRSM